jgi:uncharacterized protein
MRYLLGLVISATGLLAQFQFQEIPGGKSIELTEGGKPVWTYNYGMMLAAGVAEDRRRCCYIHPVYTPNGTVVSDDFPKDHPHHRGINWTWPVVIVDGKTYDLWTIKGIHARHEQWLKREATSTKAVLAMREGWYVGDRKVAQGDVEVTVHAASGNQRDMEFTVTIQPAGGAQVSIAGSPDNNKGYGGFEIRLASRTGTVINTANLADSPDSDMVPNAWAEATGNFAGRKASVRITIDPRNAGYPNGWCLRHYGFLGVNYPGVRPVALNGPMTMKYRLTVLDGGPAIAQKRVLVYTRNGPGYVHDNIAASVAAIQKMGKDHGFLVDATGDNNFITDATLGQYNTVVFANSNNEAFNNERQRETFQQFIEKGGGFVGIHSASGSERAWPFYWSTIGGRFVRHPKMQKFTIRVADPNHPATKGMPSAFEWEDECYFHEYLNPAIHPLLTVDPTKLDDPARKDHPAGLFGNSMPLAWTLETGKSRRFYTAIGHNKESYSNPLLYNHILGGILWTLEERTNP